VADAARGGRGESARRAWLHARGGRARARAAKDEAARTIEDERAHAAAAAAHAEALRALQEDLATRRARGARLWAAPRPAPLRRARRSRRTTPRTCASSRRSTRQHLAKAQVRSSDDGGSLSTMKDEKICGASANVPRPPPPSSFAPQETHAAALGDAERRLADAIASHSSVDRAAGARSAALEGLKAELATLRATHGPSVSRAEAAGRAAGRAS